MWHARHFIERQLAGLLDRDTWCGCARDWINQTHDRRSLARATASFRGRTKARPLSKMDSRTHLHSARKWL